jgi:hypothetical protein
MILHKRKHRKDYNHGKSGWVCGNPRYKRTAKHQRDLHKNRTMKGLGRN